MAVVGECGSAKKLKSGLPPCRHCRSAHSSEQRNEEEDEEEEEEEEEEDEEGGRFLRVMLLLRLAPGTVLGE